MKKLLTSLLTISLLLTGCGSKSSSKKTSDDKTSTTTIGTVLIDPGHGCPNKNGVIDNGATSPDGQYIEGDINLKAAQYLGEYLESKGVKVYYTRGETSDLECTEYTYEGTTYYNDLRARAELGETYNADYFISLHCDNIEGTSQKSGYHIYYHKSYVDSKELATDISDALKKAGYTPQSEELAVDSTGGEYRVIRLNTTISCLLEMGFLNGENIDYLTNDEKLKKFIDVVGDGIVKKIKAGKQEPDLKLEKQPDL